MTTRLHGDRVLLQGDCPVEEAETLLNLLAGSPGRVVDVSGVTHLHAAVFQILLALQPPIEGEPADAFMQRCCPPPAPWPVENPPSGAPETSATRDD
jgi:hypothetical protein